MGESLKEKIAIVTGAGKGIGGGIARVLAAEGARVVVVDVDESWGERTVARIRDAGGEASFFKADVSRETDMGAMAEATIDRHGRIDILCHNAGLLGPMVGIEQMTSADWDRMLNVNLRGVFLSVKACLPQMLAQRYGRIVVTSSTTGNRTAIIGLSHYAAAKGGINGFIRNTALELADRGITVERSRARQHPHRGDDRSGRRGVRPRERGGHPDGASRGARGYRPRHGLPGLRRSEVHHRPDHRGRWRPDPGRIGLRPRADSAAPPRRPTPTALASETRRCRRPAAARHAPSPDRPALVGHAPDRYQHHGSQDDGRRQRASAE